MKTTEIIVSRDVVDVDGIISKLDKRSPLTLITKQVLENLRKYQMDEVGEGRTKLELMHLKVAGDQICSNMRMQFESDTLIADMSK